MMEEEVIYGPTGIQVTFQWKKNWYRIPFFVLDDLLNEWIIGDKPKEKELARWLNTWKWPNAWTYHPVKLQSIWSNSDSSFQRARKNTIN